MGAGSRKREKRKRGNMWKKVVPAGALVVALFVVMFLAGFGSKEGAEAFGEEGASRTAGQVMQNDEAANLQRDKSDEQTDGTAGSGSGNIEQHGSGSRLLAPQEQVFYEVPGEAGILQKSPDDKDIRETAEEEAVPGYDLVLSFAGDICFDETCDVMQDYIGQGERVEHNISPELLDLMRGADVCWINNEFAYSDRGAPLENKMYTFRARPERVKMLKEMGVDIVGLANNHVYDFGPEAMTDTLDTLRQAGIAYVGAGKDLEEAMTPVYREIDGIKIAYVAASRAEKYKMTPQATESGAGILRCYDTELFLKEIREAREQADYVIALVHWGTEYSAELEEVQMSTGREYIDAGADIVIGAHPHCLQGIEYYQGKPIVYSLGNFWFNSKSLDTMLLQVRLSGDDGGSEITAEHVEVQIIPAKQEECRTRMLKGEEARGLFDYLEGISVNVVIDEEGVVRENRQVGETVRFQN